MPGFGRAGKEVEIEKEIREFLEQVSEAGVLFTKGMKAYLTGYPATFGSYRHETVDTERCADALRRDIEEKLYKKTLIPESRGDVLRLIESLDSLLGQYKGTLWRLEIEAPEFDRAFVEGFLDLVDCVVAAVESITRAIDAFFQNRRDVKEWMRKVAEWETEADVASTQLQISIFRHEGLDLSRRMHLRDFVRQVDQIADKAEDLADSLAIYVIKRGL